MSLSSAASQDAARARSKRKHERVVRVSYR